MNKCAKFHGVLQETTGKPNGNRQPKKWLAYTLGRDLAKHMTCLYLFSQTFSSHLQAKTSPRSNELVKRFETQKVHFSMSQHQGFRAFFRETSASETLQSAIAAHTILEENLKKRHLCCQCECTFSRMITLRHPSSHWRSSILHEKLWRKLSKCKEKARFDP